MSEKMSKLEDLVPPLELCKLIPEGKFADSVFEWYIPGKKVAEWRIVPCVITRHYSAASGLPGNVPAPTLAEILEKLRKMRHFPVLYFDAYKFQRWTVEDMCGSVTCDQSNPAAAALKLWLEVNGVKVK